jgi:hypothetical protein
LNNIIDKIQDAFHEYGTVFGPALLITIFEESKKGSKLRELCIAANVIHTDRGCCQLRMELMMASRVAPEFFSEMMMWISRNFVMFGRRQSEGFDVMKPTQGFSSKFIRPLVNQLWFWGILIHRTLRPSADFVDSAQPEEAMSMPLSQARFRGGTQESQEVRRSFHDLWP